MFILFSWMGIIGYALILYGIFLESDVYVFIAAAFFLVIFFIKYHSLNPFKPWMKSNSKKTDESFNSLSAPSDNNTENTAPNNIQPPNNLVSFCPSCGEKLHQNQIYCENCGSKVR